MLYDNSRIIVYNNYGVWDVNRNLFIVHWQLKYHIHLLNRHIEIFHVTVLLITAVLDRVENGSTSVFAIVLNTVLSRSSDTVLNASIPWHIQYGTASEAIDRIEYGTVISNHDCIEYG